MAYDYDDIANRVSHSLLKEPCKSLDQIASDLGVERHTIGRAVKERFGKSFRQLQTDKLVQRVRSITAASPVPLPLKQLASLLRYSSVRAASRRLLLISGCSLRDLRDGCPERNRTTPTAE